MKAQKSQWLPTLPLHVAIWSQVIMDSDLSWADQGKAIRLLCNSWSRGEAVVRPAWASDPAWGAFDRMWPEMARTMSDAAATAKRNSEHAQKAARARWEQCSGDARSMPGALPEHQSGDAQSNHPNPNPVVEIPSESLPRKRGADTWLTPFGKAWERATKGVFHYKKAASFLAPIREKHGDEKALKAWLAYLNATPVDRLSVPRFAETFGAWSGDTPPSPPPDRPNLRNSLAPVEARQNVPSYEETKRRLEAEDEERRRTLLLRQSREAAQA